MSERASNYGDFLTAIIAIGGIMFGIGEYYERSKRVDYECQPGFIVAKRDGDKLTCYHHYVHVRNLVETKPVKVKR